MDQKKQGEGNALSHGTRCAVCKPLNLGGLGIHNLKVLNDDLRLRWIWLEKEGQFSISPKAEDMFQEACQCVVGRGDRTNFRSDRWLEGESPRQLAPNMSPLVTASGARRRTVAQALQDNRWVTGIRGTPSLQAITEFVILWTFVQNQPPLTNSEDKFIWRLTSNGKYSAASTYKAFFQGTIEMDYARALWKNWALLKESILLVSHS
jgi:hypothetical protein